jgi:hypothetical protein
MLDLSSHRQPDASPLAVAGIERFLPVHDVRELHEKRVAAPAALTFATALDRFRRYWRRVVPGVRLLRHDWLRAVRRAAERRVSGHRPTVAH